MIRDEVNRLQMKFKTNDVIELADALGITIVDAKLGDINGFYSVIDGHKFISVNDELSEHKRLFIIAHEIGHSVLHGDRNFLFDKKHTFKLNCRIEREANEFAINLIFSDYDFKEFYINKGYTISQIANYFEIDENIIEYKKKCLTV